MSSGYWVAPWGSSGSFEVAGFIRVGREHVGFIRSRWVHWYALGFVRFVRGRRVHGRARWGSSGSFGVAEIIPALEVVGFVWGHWVHWGPP